MPDRSQQPPVQQLEGFTPQPPRRITLTNGVVLSFFENRCLDLIHLVIRIKAGILYEPQKRVAAFTYELLKESHPTMTSAEIDDFFDYYGATVTTACNFEYMNLNVQVPKKNLNKILPVLADLLRTPRFQSDNLERYRGKTIQDFEYYAQKTDYRASQRMLNAYFGKDFPYGKILERSDIEAVTLEQLVAFHKSTCHAGNIRLFVTGNLADDELSLVAKRFETLPAGEKAPSLPDAGVHFEPCRIAETWENALQTSMVLCRPSLPYLDGDTHKYRFLTTLFCNYFGSRLMQNLRETNGCTYGVSGSTLYYSAGSLFSIESEVNNDKVGVALDECFKEMRRICDEPVGDEELELVRNYLVGNSLRSIDGTVAYMQTYMPWDDFGCDSTRFSNFLQEIRQITAADVQNLAQRLFRPEDYTVITVGNVQ